MNRRAIILAGGSGTRLGGVSKAEISLRGSSLVERLVHSLHDCGCADIAVACQKSVVLPAGVRQVYEDPPAGGPAAGVVWAMDALGLLSHPAGIVGVFSVDAPGASTCARRLFDALATHPNADAAMLQDRGGRLHHLLAAYRAGALVENIHRLSSELPAIDGPWFARVRDLAAKRLFAGLAVVPVVELGDERPETLDINTAVDLRRWGATVRPDH